MNKGKINMSGVVVLTTLLLISIAASAFSADCLAIRKKIQQESDLLKRRQLVEEGLTNCPNDPVINFKYAYSLERFRKYDKALKHYQVATKLDPKYAKAYFGMGDMYLQTGKPQESVVAYQKGLSIDPTNKRAARSMQEAIVKAGTTTPGIATPPPTTPATTGVTHATPKTAPQPTPPRPKPRAVASTPMMPFNPKAKTIFQTPQNQLPVVANPLGKEKLQSFEFTKAGHSDATGSLDDNLMGAN